MKATSIPTPPVSRRDRPAKPPLSREAIVAAAVTLLRTEGLERLTMRRLATALDTGAGSLYVYFRNAEHLYAALLDELLGAVDLSPGQSTARGGTDWPRCWARTPRFCSSIRASPG